MRVPAYDVPWIDGDLEASLACAMMLSLSFDLPMSLPLRLSLERMRFGFEVGVSGADSGGGVLGFSWIPTLRGVCKDCGC